MSTTGDLSGDYYTPDGSTNNRAYPNYGAVGTPRIRAHPPLNSYLHGEAIHHAQIPHNNTPGALFTLLYLEFT